MAQAMPIVRIVDDDVSFAMSHKLFLQAMGWFVQTYPSAASFLEDDDTSRPGRLSLDVCKPEMTGLELQEALTYREIPLPVVFLTGYEAGRSAAERAAAQRIQQQ